MVRINDTTKFNEISKQLKYFKLGDADCRALPYLKEVTAAYRIQNNKTNNLFVKGFSKSMSTKELDEAISQHIGDDKIKSAKVSINSDRSSRGYGFVCLDGPETVDALLRLSQDGAISTF